MLELVKQTIGDKSGGLVVILTVIIMALGGSYKLHKDDYERNAEDISEIEKAFHSLDKRVTVLEVKK